MTIEEHSDIVADAGGVGRDWALPGRWAIALDDGFLVVRNTTNLRSAEAAWLDVDPGIHAGNDRDPETWRHR